MAESSKLCEGKGISSGGGEWLASDVRALEASSQFHAPNVDARSAASRGLLGCGIHRHEVLCAAFLRSIPPFFYDLSPQSVPL